MPTAAPRICTQPGCGAVVHGGTRCEAHATTHTWGSDRRRGNRHQRGYGRDWERRRQRILQRDCYLCQECQRQGRTTPARHVDHIIPKAVGGTDDGDNLQSLCIPCHREKTAREGAAAAWGGGSQKSGA